MAREGEAALLGAGKVIYQQAGKLVRIIRLGKAEETRAIRRDAGALLLRPANATWLTAEFMAEARWVRKTKKGEMSPVVLSRAIADTYCEMVDEWKVLVLVGTVETPTLYENGDDFELLQVPGYDPASRLYFDPGGTKFPPIPPHPSKKDARDALDRILSLFTAFPFVPDEVTNDWEPAPDEGAKPSRSRSVAISALLTGLIRRDMEAAPLHAFDAVSPGTGKGYLIRILCVILTGRMAAMMPWVRGEEEQRKRILSVLAGGDPIVIFDNITTPIGGAALNMMLTEQVFRDRVLGKSGADAALSALTNCLALAAGNNLVFEADTTRRAVSCRMDARCERPETREFQTNPLAEARRDRAELVVAGLTILWAYIKAGRPMQGKVKHVASYEDWTLIREAIVWLGEPDPAETMNDIVGDDPVRNNIQHLMDEWWKHYASAATKLTTAVRDARNGGDKNFPDSPFRGLFDAMHAALKGKDINETSMGNWFKDYDQRIVGGRRFVRSLTTGKTRMIALLSKEPVEVYNVDGRPREDDDNPNDRDNEPIA